MTGFLRPEAVMFLRRWREVGVAGAVALAGLWGAFTQDGILFFLSLLGLPVGGALLWEGIHRARLPQLWFGPGLVELDERLITYFGPHGGRSVSVDALTRVEIVTSDLGPFEGDVLWLLHSDEGPPLEIPANASGARAIQDALLALPSVDHRRVVQAMGAFEPRVFVIWQRDGGPRRLS